MHFNISNFLGFTFILAGIFSCFMFNTRRNSTGFLIISIVLPVLGFLTLFNLF
ncbi:hypothetical protein [Clostridium fallax]|uniref:Uncharacterized protein n=1 Tax=Clostridium fallax TaxID=1533 RepID=A0A1M4Y6H0_9CLOT|nr:hypothetical protein [Clostridium fallax]SHF01397.1 hypothetical protein SAMN05443638_12433 [Clostridium fallax]SQB07452.1 Uncharacterised protein [Clostridium fallax]